MAGSKKHPLKPALGLAVPAGTNPASLLVLLVLSTLTFLGGWIINQNQRFEELVAAEEGQDSDAEPLKTARAIPIPPSSLPKRQSAALVDLARFFGGNVDILMEVPVRARSGDTLLSVLQQGGVDRLEAHLAIKALSRVWNPRDLQPGLEVGVVYRNGDHAGDNRRFVGLYFRPDYDKDVVLYRDSQDSFAGEVLERPLTRSLAFGASVIQSSLFDAGTAARVPVGILIEMIQAFSYSVDFQRDLQQGDHFELVYEKFSEPNGNVARTGKILYAGMNLSGKWQKIYHYSDPKSRVSEFFDATGQSIKRALLRTPIDGARMSSGFGMRQHPVLGYSTFHKGIDFAAPTGTPIRAAGSGEIEKASVFGAYGNYVRIRHNKEFSTAYAHLSRYRSGIKPGTKVKQGDIIGYVGSTGRSTGPHLHYEILRGGTQINPAKVNLPTGIQLSGADLKAFRANIEEMNNKLDLYRREAAPDIAQNTTTSVR